MALPELARTSLDAVADAPLTAPVLGGYTAVSWLEATRSLGPVFRTDALGEPCVVIAGADSNRQAWQTPEDWSYRQTDAGTFFCRQMGEDHVSALDGEPHRRLRKLILPAFGAAALQRDIAATARTLTEGIQQGIGATLDLYGVLCHLFARVLTRTQLKSFAGEALLKALCEFEENFIFGQQIPLAEQERWFDRPLYRSVRATAFDHFRAVVAERRNGERADDSLQLVLDRPAPDDWAPLTDSELCEMVYLLSVAGVGNIANLICPLVHSVQDGPWAQALRDELAGADLTDPAQLRALQVLPALQRETERLFAPAPIIPKRTTRDLEFAGQPVPAGTLIMHLHTLWQFDPACFEDPLAFRPERWLEGGASKPNAFGGGKHLCLGMGVTRVLLPLTVATLYRETTPIALEAPHRIPIDAAFTPSPLTTAMRTELRARSG
jgi:cytochrome P450